ncbi:Uncharacterized MFS-type transporter [Olavius algarvensis associated proteobacterium Delta 3]|nr:Uncharacterized MFS-type transporter [Olavius algarvensis associated proteobacterium Delta 3]CAB5103399.1 Uncharacterized MFS-type transporter [Olavius algarvensis associated proteobacterium Delta 3]
MEARDKKIFATLFLSMFAVITGVGIVVPLLPVYAHHLGAGGIYIALIFGAFSLSRAVFLPYFGRLSDRKGRKPFIVIGLFAYALISIGFILSESVETLIGLRFVQGIVSAMIMPVTQAYVGDITPGGREGYTMGLFNMSVFCGLSLGPLLGGVIHDWLSLDMAFLCMGLLAFAGFLLSLVLLPPIRSEKVAARGINPLPWKWLLRDRLIAGLFALRFGYTAAIGMIWGFLPVLAAAEFSLSSSSIGILVMLGVSVSGVLHAPMGALADRFSRRALVITGVVFATGGVLLFPWADGFWDLFVANVLFGIGGGISMPAVMAMAVTCGNRAVAMGSVMGLLTMAHSMGMLAGAVVAGLAMDLLQLRHAFLIGALILVAGGILFLWATHPKPEVTDMSVDTPPIVPWD